MPGPAIYLQICWVLEFTEVEITKFDSILMNKYLNELIFNYIQYGMSTVS